MLCHPPPPPPLPGTLPHGLGMVARPVTKHLLSQRSANLSGECSFAFHAQRGIVALLFARPQKVESLKRMKKWVRCDPPKLGRGWGSNGENEKPPNTWKTVTEHPKKKVFQSRSIACLVPILFVAHKVALLQNFKSLKLNKKWESYEHWK